MRLSELAGGLEGQTGSVSWGRSRCSYRLEQIESGPGAACRCLRATVDETEGS